MWTTLKLKFAQLFYRVGLWWAWFWSKAYRWLYHRKYYRYKPSPRFTAAEAVIKMQKLQWTKDGTKELWEAWGHPGWVEYAIQCIESGGEQPEGALDCDDYSVWAAHALEESYNPYVFTLSWMRDGKLGGHAVCLCKPSGLSIFHIGNWGKSRYFLSVRSLAEDMLTKAKAQKAVGWSLWRKDMKLLAWGRGLPKK